MAVPSRNRSVPAKELWCQGRNDHEAVALTQLLQCHHCLMLGIEGLAVTRVFGVLRPQVNGVDQLFNDGYQLLASHQLALLAQHLAHGQVDDVTDASPEMTV